MEANKERRSTRTDRRVVAVRNEDAVTQVATEVAAAVPGDDDVMMMTNQVRRIGQGAREHAGTGLRVAACARLCAGAGQGPDPQDPGTFPPIDMARCHAVAAVAPAA